MGFDIVIDPDDLLRKKIRLNVIRDMERVVRRIEGLLPSIYMVLEKALEKALPGTLELITIKKILKLLDNPEKSYLIGVPFQVALIEDNYVYAMANMYTPTIPIGVLGPAKCTVLIFPATALFSDGMLRSAFVHELVHCAVGDPYEWATHLVEEMLTDLAPHLFANMHIRQQQVARAIVEYIKENRVPVISLETAEIVIKRIATDTKYANKILSKSVMIQLEPSAFWKRKSWL